MSRRTVRRRGQIGKPLIIASLLFASLLGPYQGTWSRATKQEKSAAPAAPVEHRKDDPECKSCLANAAALFAQGKNSEAASLLTKWADRCPNSAQLHLMLSTILLRTGDGPRAEAEAAMAAGIAPTSIGAQLQYGLTAMNNKHHLQAKVQFGRVTELDPGSYEGWSSLATVCKELHEDSEAAVAAQKAANLEPGTKAARLSTLMSLKRAGKLVQARGELKKLLSDTTSNAEFSEELARQALLVGAFEEAAEACQRVINSYPTAASPRLLLALAHYGQGNYSACSEDADKLSSVDNKSADAAAIKCMALVKLGRLEEADALRKTINDAPSGLVWLSKGTLGLARGDFADAQNALESCLEEDSTNAALQGLPHALAHVALKELYTKTGKTAQAEGEGREIAKDKRFQP